MRTTLKLLELRLKGGFAFFLGLPLLLICEAGGLSFLHRFLVLLAVEVDFFLHAADGFFQSCFLQLAFPNYDDRPALCLQLAPLLLVTLLVAGDFGGPEVGVGFGHRVELAAFVTMPEAAMDEDDSLIFGKDDVGLARQFLVVHPIAKTETPQCASQLQLRLCGGGMNGGHIAMALFLSTIVCHLELF